MKLGMKNGMVIFSLFVLAGCAAEKQPYQEVPKEKIINKDAIKSLMGSEQELSKGVVKVDGRPLAETGTRVGTNDLLYVPTIGDASRTAPGGRPYWVGVEKLVRLELSEKELRILELDKDERRRGNPTNYKTVMTIPVSHHDYRCSKDQYGDCTNREEEVNDKNFRDKGFVKFELDDVKIGDINLLPAELDSLFSGGACHDLKSVRVVDFRLENDALNIQVERNYQASALCNDVMSLDDLFNLNYTERATYSLVKLDALTTKGYQPIPYPQADEGTFGFFTTNSYRLSEDGRDLQKNEVIHMNRWAPNRGQVVYNLSPNFFKPENATILEATRKSVEAVNAALAEAGTGVSITLGQTDKISGDLRASEIVLIEDPLTTGLLGYGPSITNPLSGEIVYARVAMYLGNIKTFIHREYNEVVKKRRAKAMAGTIKLSPALLPPQPEPENVPAPAPVEDGEADPATRFLGMKHIKQALFHTPSRKLNARASFDERRLMKDLAKLIGNKEQDDKIKKLMLLLKDPSAKLANKDEEASLREKILLMDESTVLALIQAYPAELFNFELAIEKGMEDVIPADAKLWDEMSEAEQVAMLNKVLPHVWVPTLVHEIGHTLGLRHNFSGSEDKANFYSEQELAKMGIKRAIPYSTVMEYPATDVSALTTMGKYDIAALRFGYARKVELSDGKIVELSRDELRPDGTRKKVPVTLKELKAAGLELKEYQFCTDEHVDVNAGCKRFDEGTSLTEIAQFLVQQAEDSYEISNKRNGRRNFSMANESAYLGRVDTRMYYMRLFFEVYERVARIIAENNYPPEVWEQVEWLKDLNQAVKISARYMMGVLVEPDPMCAVSRAADPSTIIALVPLRNLNNGSADCFDGQIVNPNFTVVGQAGKRFQSKKLSTSENPYADQIDIRGIWSDKVIAAEYLLGRRLGASNLDEGRMNLLGHHEIGGEVLQVLAATLLDDIQSEITIKIPSTGQALKIPFSYQNAEAQLIREPMDPYVKWITGIRRDTQFVSVLGAQIAALLPDRADRAETERLMPLFQVYKSIPNNGLTEKDFDTIDFGDDRFLVRKGGRNLLAQLAIENTRDVRILSKVDEKRLQAIAQEIANPPVPPATGLELTDDEKAAKALGIEKIARFLEGGYKTESYYFNLLSALPVR